MVGYLLPELDSDFHRSTDVVDLVGETINREWTCGGVVYDSVEYWIGDERIARWSKKSTIATTI